MYISDFPGTYMYIYVHICTYMYIYVHIGTGKITYIHFLSLFKFVIVLNQLIYISQYNNIYNHMHLRKKTKVETNFEHQFCSRGKIHPASTSGLSIPRWSL